MKHHDSTEIAAWTTLRLGGPARRIFEAQNQDDIVGYVRQADAEHQPFLLIGGGSNIVVSDQGFAGDVIIVGHRGIKQYPLQSDQVEISAAAGESWDSLVAFTVEHNLSGLECLSGIPGSVGATPIQNVGAYGQEVAQVIDRVIAYDRTQQRIVTLTNAQCGFSYRNSVFKTDKRYVIIEVVFAVQRSSVSIPLRYIELARWLGCNVGDRMPLAQVRAAVLELRRAKGMVLDPDDRDTYSVGSFFTNPIVTRDQWDLFLSRCHEHNVSSEPVCWQMPDGRVKTSAAWLISAAGFDKGYRRGEVAISTKHTLALTNRGSGSTTQLLELAHEICDRIELLFGVKLVPEPVLVGESW